MHNLKHIITAVLLTGSALLLTACAPATPTVTAAPSSSPQQAKLLWFNTQVGAAQCLTFELTTGYRGSPKFAHDCKWDTLKPNQTVAGAENLPSGTWLKIGDQEFFCLQEVPSDNSYAANYPHYNCDWTHPKSVPAASS